MTGKYILDGHTPVPCEDTKKWGTFMENSSKRRVASTTFEKVHVSTVFLGLDHSFADEGPLLFETMIFGGEHNETCWRYATWKEAEQGHARAVELVVELIEHIA